MLNILLISLLYLGPANLNVRVIILHGVASPNKISRCTVFAIVLMACVSKQPEYRHVYNAKSSR